MNKLFEYEYYKKKLEEKYESQKTDDEKLNERIHKRYIHSLGVVDKAIELIEIYKLPIDIEKAKIAAILHDYAKFYTEEEFEEVAALNNVNNVIESGSEKVYHALLGPYILNNELDLYDEEILSAIETHSTGNSNMTPLQEILYVADLVEDNRSEDYFTEFRKLAKRNYKKVIAMSLKDNIDRISKEDKKTLHPYSLAAFNEYKKYLLNGESKYEQVLDALDHNLIKDVKVYDARTSSPFFDYIIVASTVSSRQMQACLSYLKDDFDIRGSEVGEAWTLIDLNDIVIHIFKEEERERYGLDRLYAHLDEVK